MFNMFIDKNPMNSYSQSKQDRFAIVTNNGEPGRFMDIGCSVPDWQSNSKLLLEQGWFGVGVEMQDRTADWLPYGNMKFHHANAMEIDWDEFFAKYYPEKTVEYMSLDCDFCSADLLQRIMAAGLKFKCATVEHDAYRFGNTLRCRERETLHAAGYIMIRENVTGSDNTEYEDWWVPADISTGDKIRIQMEIQSWKKAE